MLSLRSGYTMPFLSPLVRRVRRSVRPWVYRGQGVFCPVCRGGWSGWVRARPELKMCPGCESLARHRLLALYLSGGEPPLPGGRLRLLHFAPEHCMERLYRQWPGVDYLSADYHAGQAMVRMDICAIPMPDKSFDIVACSHVLEHVDDDRKAMAEILRVLRPGGLALIQVPIVAARAATFEDPSVRTPAERHRVFGQWDHVRIYGRDFVSRLARTGFRVSVVNHARTLTEVEKSRFGVWDEPLFVCRRPVRRPAAQPRVAGGHAFSNISRQLESGSSVGRPSASSNSTLPARPLR